MKNVKNVKSLLFFKGKIPNSMNRLISILLKIFPYAYKKDGKYTRMLTGIVFEW